MLILRKRAGREREFSERALTSGTTDESGGPYNFLDLHLNFTSFGRGFKFCVLRARMLILYS